MELSLSDPLGMMPGQWEALAQAWGVPRYRGRQVFSALHRRGACNYFVIGELPMPLREKLTAEVPLLFPEIARRETSRDGSIKYGLRLSDGALIEAVFMPGESSRASVNEFEDARAAGIRGPSRSPGREQRGYPSNVSGGRERRADPALPTVGGLPLVDGSRPPNPLGAGAPSPAAVERFTVCLSSQTGCSVDCAFCVTGRLGGGRNLSAGEILGQLHTVLSDTRRSKEGLRVVLMGMGEPFLNPTGVSGALDVLFEVLSPRRVTVSTSGITPAFEVFGARSRRPNLAVSVNAADEETRARLMPITRMYPLAGVIRAMRAWPLEPRRRMTAEYVLIAGVNDSERDAVLLSRLLRGLAVKVNVIPLNEDPVYLPGWKRPDERVVGAFVRRLAAGGATVTVRRSRGRDTQGACGQLKGRTEDIRKRREQARD